MNAKELAEILLTKPESFEWSITVCDGNTFTKMTYSCRKVARKEFERYKKLK